jgi:hypothetical protein
LKKVLISIYQELIFNNIEDEIDRLYDTLSIMKEKISTIKIKKNKYFCKK